MVVSNMNKEIRKGGRKIGVERKRKERRMDGRKEESFGFCLQELLIWQVNGWEGQEIVRLLHTWQQVCAHHYGLLVVSHGLSCNGS